MIITKRLKLFVNQAVQENQVGFIKGRLLCEHVLLASELVINFHQHGHVSRGCLQVDLTKAYDNLNWDFIIHILQAFELLELFVNWIKECISTPSYSIAINGELVGYIPGKKGLRQGDSVSSLLFFLKMDVLSKKLDIEALNGTFSINPKCGAPLVTHLSFADDVFIFYDGSEASFHGIFSILQDFKSGLGLDNNREKSVLFINGCNFSQGRELASRLSLKQGSFLV